MTRFVHVLLGLAVAALAIPRGAVADDAKGELDGTWELVSAERDGAELKPQKAVTMVSAGGTFVVKSGDTVVAAGTTKLDAGKKPKAVDVTYTDGPDKGRTFKGIYEVVGDTAKYCRAGTPEQERPTEFKTTAGDGGFFAVYKRVKP